MLVALGVFLVVFVCLCVCVFECFLIFVCLWGFLFGLWFSGWVLFACLLVRLFPEEKTFGIQPSEKMAQWQAVVTDLDHTSILLIFTVHSKGRVW